MIFMVLSFITKAQNALTFNSAPVMVNGPALQVGAKYRFDNVAPGTNAFVTIVSATGGATVAILDDNSLTKPEAFSPQVNVPAHSSGMVEFKIEFVNSSSGTPKNMVQLSATAMDIDGNSQLHEMDAINMGTGATVSYWVSTLEISVQQTGNEFLGTNIAGNEYSGVDTSAKQVMFTVTNNNAINNFTYKAGANNQSGSAVSRQKGIYFKGFDYAAFLPVKYSSFGASAANGTVTLNWVTENEINNKYFEIERSFNGTDFKTVGLTLDGINAGNGSKSYAFKDNSTDLAGATVIYYRLKQVDNDGRFTYSNILIVRMQATADGVKMQVSPNPFVENLNIRFTASANGTAQLQLINVNGQKIVTQQVIVSKGNNTMQLQGISKLNPGIYLAQLVVNGVVTGNQKIIKN